MKTLLMAGMMALFIPAGGFSKDSPAPALHVAVFEQSGVAPEVLEDAIAIARETFHKAGIETDWSVCRSTENLSGRCEPPCASVTLSLMLEPKAVPPGHAGEPKGKILGFALREPSGRPLPVAYVFYGTVSRVTGSIGKNAALALGCTLAHEIAHLMGLDHSPSGVMHAFIDDQDLRLVAAGLGFRPDQIKVLRAGLPVLLATLPVPLRR